MRFGCAVPLIGMVKTVGLSVTDPIRRDTAIRLDTLEHALPLAELIDRLATVLLVRPVSTVVLPVADPVVEDTHLIGASTVAILFKERN